jgi:hypothetical protein
MGRATVELASTGENKNERSPVEEWSSPSER